MSELANPQNLKWERKGGELGGSVNNQYPYPVGLNTHLLKAYIHRFYKILKRLF
jgi:hypothetical protein